MLDDQLLHRRAPEAAQVIGRIGDHPLLVRAVVEVLRDLVRHSNQLCHIHAAAAQLSSSAPARAWRRNSSCSSVKASKFCCHSDSFVTLCACTAVTLYSGQFVAQSELSVVTTLAPDSGWWNVVYTTPGITRSVISARSTVSPARLLSPTQSPVWMPRCSASCGWISSTSSSCQLMFAVCSVCAHTLYCLWLRHVVSSSGDIGVVRTFVGSYGVTRNRPLPRTNSSTCIVGVPSSAFSLHGHW